MAGSNHGRFVRMGVTTVGIFLVFFTLYFIVSLRLSKTSAFTEFDILFEMDTPRVIKDMTRPEATHNRTKVHPIYVLLMNPIGKPLSRLVSSEVNAAVALNCFFGALGVSLGFIFFELLKRSLLDAFLLACLFGVSASQFYLSVIPDTATLAVCSLIVSYLLFTMALEKRWTHLLPWIVAGVFTFGITITNFMQTLICFAVHNFTLPNHQRFARAFKRVLAFAIGTVFISSLLNVLQKLLYPRSAVFFRPEVYKDEAAWASLLVFLSPFKVIPELIRHFFLVNFIAPSPRVFAISGVTNPAITFYQSWDFSAFGWFAIVLWVSLSIICLAKHYTHHQTRNPLMLGLLLCLFFNLAFHSIYGFSETGRFEYFLYTGNFTFLVLILLTNIAFSAKIRILLGALILVVGLNNFVVIKEITSVYK